jgi:hypothetical protein
MSDLFIGADYAAAPLDLPAVLLGLLLAFLSGQLIAWIYMATHSGLSYSRSFVNSLVVIPVLVSLVMMVLSNNLVTAFGMMAVFAIVRFRNILRDTLDTTYVLSVLVIGMACGTQRFPIAAAGTLMTGAIMLYLWYTGFGAKHRYDVIVNLHWSRTGDEIPDLVNMLTRHSLRTLCASQRSHEGYEGIDLSYRLLLRDPSRINDLLTDLRNLNGVSRVTSLKAEDESEA